MNNSASLKRRHLLQLGTMGGLGLLLAGQGGAMAAEVQAAAGLQLTDLGPGIEIFTMMSSVMVGDTVYLATRNIEPMKVVGFHLPTRKVTSVTEVFGETTQALAADPTGPLHLRLCPHWRPRCPALPDRPQRAGAAHGGAGAGGGPGTVHHGHLPGRGGVHRRPRDRAQGAPIRSGHRHPEHAGASGRERPIRPLPAGHRGHRLLWARARHPATGAAVAGLYSIDRATGVPTNILPAELATTSEIRDITQVGQQLVMVNGSIGAIMDMAEPATYKVLRSPISMGKLPKEMNGLLYFAGGPGVVEYNPVTGEVPGRERSGHHPGSGVGPVPAQRQAGGGLRVWAGGGD